MSTSSITKAQIIPFEQLEKVVEVARRLLYIRTIQNAPFKEDFLPLTWIVECHSRGDYNGMLNVWSTGLESMRGLSLVERCAAIASEYILENTNQGKTKCNRTS